MAKKKATKIKPGFSCKRTAIADAFQLVAGIVPRRSLKPILTCAKLTVEDKSAVIEGTDLEVAIKVKIPLESNGWKGSIALPAEKASSILNGADDEETRIEIDGDKATIFCGNGFYRMVSSDASAFPTMSHSGKETVRIEGETLAKMFGRVALAAAEERSRYSLNGVYLVLKGKKAKMAATDGRRLALAEEKLESSAKEWSGIIPLRGINIIKKAVGNAKKTEVLTSPNTVMVRADNVEIISRLIEGKFPDYEKVIPKSNTRKMTVDRKGLLSLVKRSMILTTADTRAVKFAIKDNEVTLSSKTAEIGDSEFSMQVDYSDEAMEIDFNPTYIADALRIINTDEVVFEFKDDNSAGVLREGKTYTYVVMPLSG